MADQQTDLALLRRFEPLLRFTTGEPFLPMAVESYVQACSLWQQSPGRDAERLLEAGQLTLEKLAEPRFAPAGTVHFLKYIKPLDLSQLTAYNLRQGLRPKADVFRAGRGRLARVGYGSRMFDALFQLTLLARGRLPGDTAAAAQLAYQAQRQQDDRHCYYGRVIRQSGWLALQYWFFYPFNNWRSGFFGANDHEGDWEMITVYLSESESMPGEIRPEWVAYASHDFSGDDLRRRWDDPELSKVGEHPVVYVAAGSHASYYAAGEYLTELEIPFLAPFVGLADWLEGRARKLLHRPGSLESDGPTFNVFRIPFVDYARGDGFAIGPGGQKSWAPPTLLEPPPAWAFSYRGLWGFYARDPLAGEDAPSGPMYNRDGTIRRAWYDPVGWSGLHKMPPPDESLATVLAQRAEIAARQSQQAEQITTKAQNLLALGVELTAMQSQPHLHQLYLARQEQLAVLTAELDRLRAEQATDGVLLQAMDLHANRLRAGEQEPARAHIRRPHRPAGEMELLPGAFAEFWAAISIGLALIAFVVLALFAREFLFAGLTIFIALLLFIEATFRQQLPRLISAVTIALTIVACLVLLYEFFWSIVTVGVVAAGLYLIWDNLRELWA